MEKSENWVEEYKKVIKLTLICCAFLVALLGCSQSKKEGCGCSYCV